jgi:hypothetical protein
LQMQYTFLHRSIHDFALQLHVLASCLGAPPSVPPPAGAPRRGTLTGARAQLRIKQI